MQNEKILNKLERIRRSNEFLAKYGIDKDRWCYLTKNSEPQFYRWYSPTNPSAPTVTQAVEAANAIDMSVAWCWQGVGPDRLTELRADYTEYREAIDRFISVFVGGGLESTWVEQFKRLDALEDKMDEILGLLSQILLKGR